MNGDKIQPNKRNLSGKFVTIEGCEGVGKSTQTRLIKEYCELNGIDAVFTREPGGTQIAERIRSVILDPQNTGMDGYTELLLYEAARREHTLNLIIPELERGKIVFCDRYTDSTTAYQAYARGLGVEAVEYLNRIGSANLKIDLTVFIDLDCIQGFSRKGGADKSDRLENEGTDFHERVYEGFKSALKKDPQRFERIDASGSKLETHGKIIAALKKRGIF